MAYGKRKRSRRKRPRARKAIDKSQNRRIKRLEDATEKKYSYGRLHTALSKIVTNTSQIYPMIPRVSSTIPTLNQGIGPDGHRIGNEICLKNITCKVMLDNKSSKAATVRMIFFWVHSPRTYAVLQPSGYPEGFPMASTAVTPTWQQLLNDVVLSPAGTDSLVNINATRQKLTASNLAPISILSDRVYQLGGFELSNKYKRVTFSKSYKSMKLTYNTPPATGSVPSAYSTDNLPVNRQLFLAVLADNQDTYVPELLVNTSIVYTDA